MKTKGPNREKVNVITLGCSKNIYDSEVLMSQLKANQFEVKHEEDNSDASTVIINTCGFIDNAKQESIDTIIQFAGAKTAGHIDKLIVTGCLSERYQHDLAKEIPEVDSWFGTRDLPRLLKSMKADYKKELIGERMLTTPFHYAYMKIAEGCDRPCSFCAIPLMRGKHRSVPEDELVERAKNLVKGGAKEVMLIAQDLTYYGLDIYKERTLARLLEKLAGVEGLEWIKLHYAFPSGFPEDVLDVMAKHDNICNYLDMPLQHCTDNMLKAMRRGITRERSDRLLRKIKERVPGVALRTTLIAGYPGETEEDFQEMKVWVKEMKFDRLGIFTYSHEEDTHAYNSEDDVPAEVKKQRADEIMEIQEGISYEKNQAKIGEQFRVLIDRAEGDYFVGRTEFDSPEVDNLVYIPKGDEYLATGTFVNVEVTDAEAFDLFAKPLKL